MRWLLCVTLIFFAFLGYSQEQLEKYTFEEVDSLSVKNPRPIFVFLYADWCRICHQMKSTALSDTSIVQILNSAYYYIPFNGESHETVFYQNVEYKFEPTGVDVGTHALATALGQVNGKVNYPTLCIIKNQTDIVFKHGGALSAKELLAILQKGTKP